jgi:predicted DNA-binding transcriptional regulator YafY
VSRKSASATVAGALAAFIERPTWGQAELARHLGVTSRALKRCLEDLAEVVPLEREEEPPAVYWSVPHVWVPKGLVLTGEQVPELLRILIRSKGSTSRDKLIRAVSACISGAEAPDASRVVTPTTRPEERLLSILEDAAARRVPVRMRYHSASTGALDERVVSVENTVEGDRVRFVGTCHASGRLQWFRVDGVTEAVLDPTLAFVAAPDGAANRFISESVDGFHDGEPTDCVVFVRDPEARWVVKNLPTPMTQHRVEGGVRLSKFCAGGPVVARWVLGLGDAAIAESPRLRRTVVEIATRALQRHSDETAAVNPDI